jgi:hypothetical protein
MRPPRRRKPRELNHEEHEGHKTGEACFLSLHPAGELQRRDKVLFFFVIFVNFVVSWF